MSWLKKTLFALMLLNAPVHGADTKTVILIPFNENDTRDEILASQPPGNFWYTLKTACAAQGYTLTTTRTHDPQDVFAIVAFNAPSKATMKQIKKYTAAKRILFTWEPPCIHPRNFHPHIHDAYDRVLTWQDDLIDGNKYQKFNYALGFAPPQEVISFSEKKAYCMFVGNKTSSHPNELYSERLATIQFLEDKAPRNFDLYGPDWSSERPSYRGFAENKIAYMKHYRFPIVYENMKHIQGYITEKIFDAFSAGCVPVYWGASNITQYIPKNTFIAREDFNSISDLFAHLETLSEEDYNHYLGNIRAFLLSDQARLFSCDHFVETFLDVLNSCNTQQHEKIVPSGNYP